MKFRLVWAIISVIVEEIAIMVVALLVFPQFDIKVSTLVLVLIMFGWLVFSALLYVVGVRALDRKPVDDMNSIIGKRGVVIEELNPKGLVKVNGELWGAESAENIAAGEEVIITGYSGIRLKAARYIAPSDKIA
jgi:membrane protein implicated in regulation of membrane protease activity